MGTTNVILGISNISVAVPLIALAIPLVHRKVKMNRVYGIRTKSAFQSDENWYKINAYGGRQLIAWSIPLFVVGIVTFFLPLGRNAALTILIACAPFIVLVPAFTSWRYGNRLTIAEQSPSSDSGKAAADGGPTGAHEGWRSLRKDMKKESSKVFYARKMLSLILLICVQGCVATDNPRGKEYYTKANIWYTNPKLIKSTNYHMGVMIPFGTKVVIEKINNKKVVFRTTDSLSCEMVRIRKHSTISMNEIFNRYFTTIDPMINDGLFHSFTDVEQENIIKGNIVVQMSKEAVLASYGYPPSHATRDLNQNYWRYWVVGREEIWVSFFNNRVQSIEKVAVSGPPPGRKQVIKVSSLME